MLVLDVPRRAQVAWVAWVAWGVAALVAACSGAQSGGGPRRPLTARDYMPLRTGAAWSYDTETGHGEGTVLATLAVVRAEPPRYLVRSGRQTERYELRGDGVVREGDYILKDPLRAGTSWTAQDGGTLTIRAVGQRREVTAGRFERVVEVARTSPDGRRTTTTWFAPNVGVIEVLAEDTASNGYTLRVRSSLRGYTLGEEG